MGEASADEGAAILPYAPTAELEWTEKAVQLLSAGLIKVSAVCSDGVWSAHICGECPRCRHPMDSRLPVHAAVTGLRGAGGKRRAGGAARRSSVDGEMGLDAEVLDWRCACTVTHPGGPADGHGCGVIFRLPVALRNGGGELANTDAGGSAGPSGNAHGAIGLSESLGASELAAFDKLVADSLSSVHESIRVWRNGLAGLITLISTGAVFIGRDSVKGVAEVWRLGIAGAMASGLLLASVGLWQTLVAEAGDKTRLRSLRTIHEQYDSVAAYKVSLAMQAGSCLRRARLVAGVALGVMLLGAFIGWFAPETPAIPPAYLRVESGLDTYCGTVLSGDAGTVVLKTAGKRQLQEIPLAGIQNLTVVENCN